jgi:hypothetical protein
MNNPSGFTVATRRAFRSTWKGAQHFFTSYTTYHVLGIIAGAALTVVAVVIGAAYGVGLGVDFVLGRLGFSRGR